jgi:hypothetical protein
MKEQPAKYRTVRVKVRTTTRTLLSKKILQEMIERSNKLNKERQGKEKPKV